MRIAIPLADGRLSSHFGHCDQFALVDVDEPTKEIRATALHAPPAHAPGALPAWLAEQGAEVVIAGGIGQRAQQLFTASGIDVVVGAPASAQPQELVRAYLDGTLAGGQNVCDH